jgi:hypothetical protein
LFYNGVNFLRNYLVALGYKGADKYLVALGYKFTDKSLARPGRKQANISGRMARISLSIS